MKSKCNFDFKFKNDVESEPEPEVDDGDDGDDGDDEDDEYHAIEDYVWEIPEPEVLHVENGSYMIKVLPRLPSNSRDPTFIVDHYKEFRRNNTSGLTDEDRKLALSFDGWTDIRTANWMTDENEFNRPGLYNLGGKDDCTWISLMYR